MKKIRPTLPADATTEVLATYLNEAASYIGLRLQAAATLLDRPETLDGAAAILGEERSKLIEVIAQNAELAHKGTVDPSVVTALTEAKAELERLDAEIAELRTQRDAQATALNELSTLTSSVEPTITPPVAPVATGPATTDEGQILPEGGTEVFSQSGAEVLTSATQSVVNPEDVARMSASTGILNQPTVNEAMTQLGRTPVGFHAADFRPVGVNAGLAMDSSQVNQVLRSMEQTVSAGTGLVARVGHPTELQLTSDRMHNEAVFETLVAAKAVMERELAPSETTNDGYRRMQATFDFGDSSPKRMQAAAITTCLVGQFELSNEQCSTTGTPVKDGFFDNATINVESPNGFPVSWYPSVRLSEIQNAPGAALIDSEATKTSGVYDPKACFIIPKNCPPVVSGTIGPRKTCICWDVDDVWSWKDRLRARFALTQVLADRRSEVRRIDFALSNPVTQVVPIPYTYSILQSALTHLPRRMEQLKGQERMRGEGASFRALTHPLFFAQIWEELQMMPGYAVPQVAANFTSEADIIAWFRGALSLSSITIAIDDSSIPTLPRTLLPAPAVGTSDTVAPANVPWMLIARPDSFREMNGPEIRLGQDVDNPHVSWTQVINNQQCTFHEYTEGHMIGRGTECIRPQLFTFPGACGDGRYAAAATAAICAHLV